MTRRSRWLASVIVAWALICGVTVSGDAQLSQEVLVTIQDYTFKTTQMPLQLHVPTIIHIRNADKVRHDFGSDIFSDTYTEVNADGAISYGTGIGGVFIDPRKEVEIQFTINRPGHYRFQCSIHKEMKGEIVLLSVGAV